MNWHITDFGIEEIWNQGFKGQGIKVAILDSGLMISHPDINASNIVASKNFLYHGDDDVLSKDVTDNLGHGTHCAGIVASLKGSGVAPEASLMIGKITDSSFGVDENVLVEAIEWAYKNDADVISISITVKEFGANLIEKIAELDEKHKAILVCSVSDLGDLGFNADFYPAMLNECLAVGAVNKSMEMDPVTGRSSKIDILAPGREINSTWNNGAYKTETGCSMSTPFVAGVLALILARNTAKGVSTSKAELKKNVVSLTSKFAKFKDAPQGNYSIISPTNHFK